MDNPSARPWSYHLTGDRTRLVVTKVNFGQASDAADEICTLPPTSEADARLIAATPDLLVALRDCVIPLQSGPVFSQDPAVLERAFAALSKATFWTHPGAGCSREADA
jgi:hypothetical protein